MKYYLIYDTDDSRCTKEFDDLREIKDWLQSQSWRIDYEHVTIIKGKQIKLRQTLEFITTDTD